MPAHVEDLQIHAEDYCKYFRKIFGDNQELRHLRYYINEKLTKYILKLENQLEHYQLRLFWPITNFFKLPIRKLLCCSKPLISKVFKAIGILSLGLFILAKNLSFYFVKNFYETLSLQLFPTNFFIDLNYLMHWS